MGWLMDFKYQEGAKTYAPIIHKPFEQFSPSYQVDSIYAPSVFIESPGSKGAVVTTKKEATQTPYIGGADVTAPTGDIQTPDYTILIIGVAIIGAVAWAYTSKKKR